MTDSTQNGQPRGKAAPATQGKPSKASTSSTGAAKNSSFDKQAPMPGAHVPLERKALENGIVVLRSAMDYGFVDAINIPPEHFHPELQSTALIIRNASDSGARGFAEILQFLIETTEPGESQVLARSKIAEYGDGAWGVDPNRLAGAAKIVREYHLTKLRQLLTWELNTPEGQESPRRAEIIHQLGELESGAVSASLKIRLAAREFDFSNPPPKPIPLLQLCGMPLSTAGNILNIQGPPKVGKSAVEDSMIAAIFTGSRKGPDTLGFSAENPQGRALVHFDTEQSRYDHDALVRRAARRAGISNPPEWFHSYSVVDFNIHDRRLALRHVMDEAREAHGGILAVMIDGIGDLCADPNDSEESFGLVAELHTLATTYDCAIITVLHENPGSESGKTRGHLGSQLERKAETNLRLAKDSNGITTIWAERARHCHLPKEQGPCFSWNVTAAMHTSCGTAGEIKSAAIREKMKTEAFACFGGADSHGYTGLVAGIMDVLTLKERAAKERVKTWAAEGIIHKVLGNYTLEAP